MCVGITIAAGAAITGAVISAHAAGKAADVQQTAAATAADKQAPWVNAGSDSIGKLMQGIDNGTYGPGSIPAFTAPTAAQAQATPGYGFTQAQGQRGVLAAASAGGRSLGGGTLKAIDQYNTGLADSTYNDTFNRSLSTYQAQLQGQNQSYNQLLGVSNQGEAATANVGNLMTQGANAQAAGIVGQANAVNTGLSTVGTDVLQQSMLNQLLTKPSSPGPQVSPALSSLPLDPGNYNPNPLSSLTVPG